MDHRHGGRGLEPLGKVGMGTVGPPNDGNARYACERRRTCARRLLRKDVFFANRDRSTGTLTQQGLLRHPITPSLESLFTKGTQYPSTTFLRALWSLLRTARPSTNNLLSQSSSRPNSLLSRKELSLSAKSTLCSNIVRKKKWRRRLRKGHLRKKKGCHVVE